MTLRQLQIFQAVARHLNLTKAAHEVHISQPTVSKQLRLLEEEFRARFHLRIGQGIRLTEEGQLFRATAGSILSQVEDLKKRLGGAPPLVLKVGGTQSPSEGLLPETLKAFRRTHPSVRPIFRTGDSQTIEQLLLSGEIEIALITSPSSDPRLLLEPLRSEEVLAVVSGKHPLAKKAKLSAEELVKVPFIIRTGGRIARQLEQTGLKLNVVMQCESSEVVKAAVQSGYGMALLYRDIVEMGLKGGYLKSIAIPGLKEIAVTCFIASRKGEALSPAARDFLRLLQQRPAARHHSEAPRSRRVAAS